MKKTIYGIKMGVCAALLMTVVLLVYTLAFNVATETRIKQGEQGDRVVLVQEKLKELGIYDGECNGIYDIETANAVRRFQEYNGLRADGVARGETLEAMGLALYTYSDYELDVLAKLIESEAGEYDLQTMTAVGAVVLNRVKDNAFPDSIVQVIYSGGSFDSIVTGKINEAMPSELAYRAAEDAMMGFDPTDGALYVLHGGSYGYIITMQSGDLFFGR
ncbi:MAG: peptidoglycan-binding protein [Clostridia bacterium]|nr:peptidoglycan-binding protein [Clostridia bacterium]